MLTAITAVPSATEAAPLEASLTSTIPDPLEVGAGTILYLEGFCDRGVEPGSLIFAILINGHYVDPKEWWDPKWVREHIDARLVTPTP